MGSRETRAQLVIAFRMYKLMQAEGRLSARESLMFEAEAERDRAFEALIDACSVYFRAKEEDERAEMEEVRCERLASVVASHDGLVDGEEVF